ncbi:TonB-dependent receptor [Pseudogulbenkiania ferrooxidans]|uniref:TonB-dependent siderophore receptor n=1 Tax=Pseudogulbenkiania ferrooxidans 2002 TaxID=279714 RepID=B9Z1B9_9NEIS|nr:TonB-dependent siderophore receptor [Pseudogulbenkiania ferrooxidans]EEG09214.1 TonB-dependent siderophore receptor [Pseudogulbenkiania ferrooxidans 2002]
MKQKTLSTLISLIGTFGALPVLADTELPAVRVEASQDADPTTSYTRASSTSATKIAAPLKDVPQTVNVVPAAVLKDQNASSLQDALANVPGVSFSVGDAQRDQVSIRGFSAINDQYVDGVRDDALYYRDLSNVERVEVLKGPSSVLYGRGSSGGLINRITKKPQAEPVHELAVSLDDQGKQRLSFDIGANSDDDFARFRLTGALEDSEGFRNQSFLKREAVAPSLQFNFSPNTTLLLQADYLQDKRLADQGVPGYKGKPVDVPIETYYGSANGRDQTANESDVTSFTGTLDHQFDSGLKLHNVFRTYDFSLDRNYTTIASVNETTNQVTIDRTKRLRDEHGFYNQLELSHDLDLAQTRHTLLYGLEVGKQHKTEKLWTRKNAATYDLFDPQLIELPAINTSAAPGNDNDTDIDIAALYLQDLVSLSEHWKALAGARYDHLTQTRDDKTSKNQDLARTDNTISPRLGVVYQPTERVSLYASASQSFQPIADSFTFKQNSDQLKPEETINYEVGSKIDLFDNLTLTTSVFEMTRSNIQAADPSDSNKALSVGEQRVRGLELAVAGALTPLWDVIAGYAYLDGEITQSTEKTKIGTPFQGNKPALTPRHSANLFVKRKLPGGFNVNAGLRYEGERYASPDNLVKLPGYTRFDLGTGYSGKSLEVNFTLKNVFDKKYYISAHSGANDYNMPGAPRTAEVTARWKF